jgi:ferredoxin--NADP+ reductase
VVGWAKRGPTGVIGTNKPDAQETVDALLADAAALARVAEADADPQAFVAFIVQRQPNVVSYLDWQVLDRIEMEKGKLQGRPRVKFNRVEDMLEEIARSKNGARANGQNATGEQVIVMQAR